MVFINVWFLLLHERVRKEFCLLKIKVTFFDRELIREFLSYIGVLGGIYTYLTIFFDSLENIKGNISIAFFVTLGLLLLYLALWIKSNLSKKSTLNINGSTLEVKVGNIFEQEGFKVIAFNEYFDTIVDDDIISRTSLNGIFIENELNESIEELDKYIYNDLSSRRVKIGKNVTRQKGKNIKYPIGTICKYNDFLLAAFSKFDKDNKACLTMKEYINFLMKFWEEIDRVYAGKSISIPLLGSGITRFTENISISDQELLEILIWSFKISRVKIKYPSSVSIIIYHENMDKINFYKLREMI